jgi:heme ABC exporter ATP-binding subunit CcmA
MTAGDTLASDQGVQIKGLNKSFSGNLALRGVDLTVNIGEFLTVFGPNGAGKTTLLRVLATITRPSAGRVWVSGLEAGKDSTEIRRRVGYVPHQTLLYDDLTACENLRFYGKMYDVPDLESRIQALAERMGLTSQLHRLVRTLSRGIQQRFSIIRALLHDPTLLLLDEPETGLDQQASAMMVEMLDAGARTVIMTSHRLEGSLELADRAVILASGRITYDAPKSSLDKDTFAGVYARHTEIK